MNSNGSPVFYGSPNSFSYMLESRGTQHVPCTPPLECLRGRAAHNDKGMSGVSPVEQTVPMAVHRAYSGSPLLRQIFRNGKRQREDGSSPETPSPIAVSRKRFRGEECTVPTSLVVLMRSAPKNKGSQQNGDQHQVVPSSPKEPVSRPVEVRGSEETAEPEESGFKWFDFFPGESNELTQPEE